MTTPLEISILIHYYARVGDFENYDAPAQKEAIKKFIRLGLLEFNHCDKDLNQKYIGNREALNAYIDALVEVPLPKQKWVVENNNEFKGCQE